MSAVLASVGALRDLLDDVTTREEAEAVRDLLEPVAKTERDAAKGARTPLVKALDAALLHLTRAGRDTDIAYGLRAARTALSEAVDAMEVTA